MFEARVAIGERVAVWCAPEYRTRTPVAGAAARSGRVGPGASDDRGVRAVGAAGEPGDHREPRRSRSTPAGGPARPATSPGSRSARSRGPVTGRRVVLPGDPTAIDAAFARWRGHPGDARTEMDRALRLGLIDGVTEVGAAMLDLGCWRTRISTLPPGPDLVTALTQRPDALAPAPVTDPDQALATAWAARDAECRRPGRHRVGQRRPGNHHRPGQGAVLVTGRAVHRPGDAVPELPRPGRDAAHRGRVRAADQRPTAGNAISTARAMTMRLPAHPGSAAGRVDRLRARHGTGLRDRDHHRRGRRRGRGRPAPRRSPRRAAPSPPNNSAAAPSGGSSPATPTAPPTGTAKPGKTAP